MQLPVIQRILGLLLMIFSSALLPPIGIGMIYQDGAILAFFQAFLLIISCGFLLYFPVRSYKKELRLRDGFLVVVLFWSVLGIAGGLPLYLSGINDLSITDAIFESISGLTTTGATVIVGLDHLPHAILFYRQELQWLGVSNGQMGMVFSEEWRDVRYRWFDATGRLIDEGRIPSGIGEVFIDAPGARGWLSLKLTGSEGQQAIWSAMHSSRFSL